MKYFSALVLLLGAATTNSAFALNQRLLAMEAEDSIYEFFNSSGRKVQRVNIEAYSHLTSGTLDYLVEAEVKAQSPINQGFIEYHCGVFIKINRNRFESQQTACEVVPSGF